MAKPKPQQKIVDALMALAAERPWDEVTLEAVAERAGVTLAALRADYDGRRRHPRRFHPRASTRRVLAGIDPTLASEAPRERLFDVLFARFEALRRTSRRSAHRPRRRGAIRFSRSS